MGPKRFGTAGQLAFSYGNVAQDEGAADAQIAKKQGWKTAIVVTDKQIVYSQNVCQAFANKFKSLGGKVVSQQTWTQGDHTVANVASRVNGLKADVIQVCTTAAPDISRCSPMSARPVTRLRSSRPWSLDGTYWMPKDPKISTNFWTDSYTSIYGDDPSPAVRAMIAKLKAEGHAPTTGGFVAGAAAIDGIAAAVKQTGGSLDGPSSPRRCRSSRTWGRSPGGQLLALAAHGVRPRVPRVRGHQRKGSVQVPDQVGRAGPAVMEGRG